MGMVFWLNGWTLLLLDMPWLSLAFFGIAAVLWVYARVSEYRENRAAIVREVERWKQLRSGTYSENVRANVLGE